MNISQTLDQLFAPAGVTDDDTIAKVITLFRALPSERKRELISTLQQILIQTKRSV